MIISPPPHIPDSSGSPIGTQRSQMRILVVEPHPWLSARLRECLPTEQYTVDTVRESMAVRALALGGNYKALILGLSLDENMTLCRALSADGNGTPVLVALGTTGVRDVVATLNSGADDVISGALNVEEIAARLRALMRRHQHHK